MKEKVETLESRRKEGQGKDEGGKEVDARVTERLREIERKMEWRGGGEREERRRNIIMKEVKVKEGKRREAVEKVLGMVGAKIDILEVKRLKGDGDKEGEMVLVKLSNKEQKREVMEKNKLREERKD